MVIINITLLLFNYYKKLHYVSKSVKYSDDFTLFYKILVWRQILRLFLLNFS
jgi:hypothetical protein